jgi:hypothetical protein
MAVQKSSRLPPSKWLIMQHSPFENADRWFKSKISLLAYDEESGENVKQICIS